MSKFHNTLFNWKERFLHLDVFAESTVLWKRNIEWTYKISIHYNYPKHDILVNVTRFRFFFFKCYRHMGKAMRPSTSKPIVFSKKNCTSNRKNSWLIESILSDWMLEINIHLVGHIFCLVHQFLLLHIGCLLSDSCVHVPHTVKTEAASPCHGCASRRGYFFPWKTQTIISFLSTRNAVTSFPA